MTKNLVNYAMATALIVALSIFIAIPVPATKGYISLIDAGILTISLLAGPVAGGLVGGMSGALVDLIAGYPHWAIFSFIVHGLEGYIAGKIASSSKRSKRLALFLASLTTVVGYFLASWILYGLVAAAIGALTDFIQVIVGSLLAYILSEHLKSIIKPS